MIDDFWFLSFADSRLGGMIRNPVKRIRHQAEAMDVFGDRIRVWTEFDLDADYRERMKEHLVPGSRGFGYWCWKPQIVLQVMREMREGDVVLYADIGCHLNPRGIKRLGEYHRMAKRHGIVAFQARTKDDPPRHFLVDGDWSKGDLLDFFGVRGNKDVTGTGQLGGGVFLVCKSRSTEDFFGKFAEIFAGHFELCDDSPSKAPNLPGFVENRHDQSVFSLLGKAHGVFSLSAHEYDPMTPGGDWSCMAEYPVWSKHDKGGLRSLFPNSLKRVVHSLSGGRI